MNIKDIARKLQISPSTVSRALNNNPQISEATRERVHRAARDMGYRRNAQASALRTGNSYVIGLIVANIRNHFFNVLAYEIEQAATELGYTLMLANAAEDPARQEAAIHTMLDHHIDGLVIVPTGQPSPAAVEMLRSVPLVSIDRSFPELNCAAAVSTSTAAADELMTELAARGYLYPVFLCGPQDTSTGRERRHAVESAAKRAGFERFCCVESRFDEAGGRAAMQHVCDGDPVGATGSSSPAAAPPLEAIHTAPSSSPRGVYPGGPDVVVCSSSQIALGALAELTERGLSIGQDIGFATFDDVDWLRVYQPSITVIDTHVAELARAAMALLHEAIDAAKNPAAVAADTPPVPGDGGTAASATSGSATIAPSTGDSATAAPSGDAAASNMVEIPASLILRDSVL